MKRTAAFVFAAAILTGSAAVQAHAVTVDEVCGGCVMPEGAEQYAAYEVLVETYDVVVYSLPELAPPLVALTRRLVARQSGFATTVLIDQIVVGGNIVGYSGPGLVIDVIVIQEDGSVSRYERRLQEVVEYLFLMQYGRNRRW